MAGGRRVWLPFCRLGEADAMIVSVEEMKNDLRVDFEEDDALLAGMVAQAEGICLDVARAKDAGEFGKEPSAKLAVMFAAAYLYEHREEADHHALVLGLRSILFGIRREAF